jgi:hypothetical protein
MSSGNSQSKEIGARQRTAQQRALTEFGLEKMANEYFLEYQNLLSKK